MSSAEECITGNYRIISSAMSPYSVKVRAFFRYKNVLYEWVPRRAVSDPEFQRYARLPLLPTVVTPDGRGLQDSTLIIQELDELHPEPSVHPEAELAFLSMLIEEFGDEWANKLMFHSRWWGSLDRQAAAQTVAHIKNPDGNATELRKTQKEFLSRMEGRRHFTGSTAANAPLMQRWFIELIDLLEEHFATGRSYLFGARPSFGDFGLAAEIYEALLDPTCGAILRGRASDVIDWALRMNEPKAMGSFEEWGSLRPTMQPLLAYIGRYFLPWSAANAEAIDAGCDTFGVRLGGALYEQQAQTYHAKSLKALRKAFGGKAQSEKLTHILSEANCLQFLTA